MIITIDILSLILGFFIGAFITLIGITCAYFNDRWDTGFGYGWQHGYDYGKEEAERKNKNNAVN